jgi:Helix-turn-helix domain
MTVTEEPTLYDVLEVDPASSIDELRAAVERARETYGTESLAVYALVDEGQLGELRARLDEAEQVLLDPARRATYDRSIGRIGPATLWAEDDEDEDAPPLPPIEPGPHARSVGLEADDGVEVEEEEEAEPPRQQALAFEVPAASGVFGRAPGTQPTPEHVTEPAERSAQPEALLSGDWAAAVAGDHANRPVQGPAAPVAREERTSAPPPEVPERIAASTKEESPPERTGLPPPLGLRIRPAPRALPEEPVFVEPEPPPPAPPPASTASDRPPELPTRPREHRLKLDIPADAEFNGELLRRVRESYGLSLQQVAERTRITRIHLENVEADRYDRLPATVYLRGILVNLARELRLDPARVSKTYLLAAQRSHARGS